MPYRNALLALTVSAIAMTPALALAAAPPADAMPLSKIVQNIEARADFAYIDEIDWDDDGYYEVEYFTKDGAKVEIKLDPRTGEPRRR